MSTAKITVIGLENYLNPDRSLFDTLVLPEGIDKGTLIGAIALRCQEFELLYSDPDFLIDAINLWSRKHYYTFDKWLKAINIKYDPLFNYDRTEEYTDTHTGQYSKDNVGTLTGSSSTTNANTQTNDLTQTNNLTDTNDITLTHSEKAYNDANFVDSQKDVTDQDQHHTGTVKDTGTVSNNGTVNGSYGDRNTNNENGNDIYTNIHKARLYGNIGVTTSQQMLQSELDIARWNIYEHIADLFCEEFCIMVY